VDLASPFHEADKSMRVGIPKEIKDHEYRVGLTPSGARTITAAGHDVVVETQAGARVGFPDSAYEAAGAKIVPSAKKVYACDLIVKVKELQPREYPLLKRGQLLFGYQHLAPEPELLAHLLQSGVSALAYETVTDSKGQLPLLIPMSQIAGRLAVQAGAQALSMANGGSGVLLSGVPGVPPAKVIIIGAGTVGANAARIAIGMGAEVTVLDVSPDPLIHLEELYPGRVKTCYSSPDAIDELVREADLVIGALLLPGRLSPKLISRPLARGMRPGSALVDVAIDQGGISETSRPSSHSDPFYVEEGVVHYCVPNMPAACARTATLALTQVTLPYVRLLAEKGLKQALSGDPGLKNGLQIHAGEITYRNLAQDVGRPFAPFEPAPV
jgi:alanine dehydrogenase